MRGGFLSAPLSPARDLKDFNDLRDLFLTAPIRAESPKAPSPGQDEQRESTPWVDHIPNGTPYRGKSKKTRTCAITAFALSERTPSNISTQGAVPAELALGYALSAPLGRAPQNLNPYNLTTPYNLTPSSCSYITSKHPGATC